MTAVIDIRDLTKSYGGRTLLDAASLAIQEGEKVGLIGRNGSGKTTLLRIVAGLEGCDEGTIALRRRALVGYLPQDPTFDLERTVFETAAEDRARVRADAPEWSWSHQVEATLTRLGIDRWDRPMESLSGGERRRVAVARALLSEPDLLLLDEPTNHLDADTILWLEETLFDFPGSILVATHDRYFLDRVVDRMVEIGRRTLTSYDGGYTAYLEARAERDAREKVEEAKQIRFLEQELAWARRSPPARTGKQKARRRRARELEAERLERSGDGNRLAELEIGVAPRLGKRILELEGVTKSYEDRVLIKGFSDGLLAGERIGIVGPNGIGENDASSPADR